MLLNLLIKEQSQKESIKANKVKPLEKSVLNKIPVFYLKIQLPQSVYCSNC